MKTSPAIDRALELPKGARFYRCALQVNPFAYLRRHNKPNNFQDEESYNKAIVHACQELRIEVIAVTDHYRIKDSEGLINAARAAGIAAFPGFEAVTKDGVHFLCLFDQSESRELVQAKIHDCGIHDDSRPSPIGKYDSREFLDECEQWGAVCIAAHAAADSGGLLKVLSGQSRMAAWTSEQLVACSLPGPVKEAPESCRAILENKDPQYKRARPIAVLNSQDVSDPADFKKQGTWCWIKMSTVSLDGLRQAFLDPDSRIRLAGDPLPEDHVEFVAMTWEGGFLSGSGIHFNENLNVLIGGRGTGKSTVIESLRCVLQLQPATEDASRNHNNIIQDVLGNGTKISLLVRSHRPDKSHYLIERTVPNPSIVKDEFGNVLAVAPGDVIPRIEIFGQHEISEVAKNPIKRTRLLTRFIEPDSTLIRRKEELARGLDRSKRRILDVSKELEQIDERLSRLPAVEETLKRYQSAHVEEKLKEQSLIVREERILSTAIERLAPFESLLAEMRDNLPIDTTFVTAEALDDLPGKSILAGLSAAFDKLGGEVAKVSWELADAITEARTAIGEVNARWSERKRDVQQRYEAVLRELQKERIDGGEFIKLRKQIEDLRPLKERKNALLKAKEAYEQERRNLLAEWEDIQGQEFQKLEKAAKQVSKELKIVRVRPQFAGNRQPLSELIRSLGGKLSAAIESLENRSEVSLRGLADASRKGRDELTTKFSLSPGAAVRLSQAGDEFYMQLEELDLPPTTTIELNVSLDPNAPEWKDMKALSTGQQATAVLLLLLLEADAPLVVDQPEDDLDNRFITESVVPRMRDEKQRRQFVFSTHNANIPVLGDAELILGLSTVDESGQVQAQILASHMGSIDSRPVRELVEEILEGGKEAFEMRRKKYGF
jgi:DNA repair ATPase RecN